MIRNTTLDTKISSLANIGPLRDNLQQALLILRHNDAPSEVMDHMTRTAFTLMSRVLVDANRKLPGDQLRVCSEAAYKLGLFPQPFHFSMSGIIDWSDPGMERVAMTTGRAEVHLAILLETVIWYCSEYEKGPKLPAICREDGSAGLPSLDIQIASLADIGVLRDELQKSLSTLRHADNPISVMNGLSRTALILMSHVYDRIGQKRPNDLLGECCDRALRDNLLPHHIYCSLGSIRVWSNKADHAVEKVALTTGRAEVQLALMLDAVFWYCCEYEHGPKMAAIYREESGCSIVPSPQSAARPATAFTGNWPLFSGECVGRDACFEEICQSLTEYHALVLEGGPGYGKTRLAYEYAAKNQSTYSNGLFFASLTTLPVGTNSLSLTLYLDNLMHTLSQSDEAALLVLDNCEHIAEAAVEKVGHLLREHSNLHILATSRTALSSLQHYIVEALPVPEEVEVKTAMLDCAAIEEYPAVSLFLQRARTVTPRFRISADNAEQIIAICRRVEGIPFALELIAKSVHLRLEDILASLEDPLEDPEQGDLAASAIRHGTVDRCVRWSVNLLSEDARHFLYRASIFRGGFSLDAYREVVHRDAEAAPVGRYRDAAIVELTRHELITKAINDLYELPSPVRLFAQKQLKQEKQAEYPALRASYEEWLETQHQLPVLRYVGSQSSDQVHLAVTNTDEALEVADRIAAKRTGSIEDEYHAAQVRSQRATYLMISGKIFQSNKLFRQALPYMTDHKKCEVLLGIGMVMYLKCEFEEALAHARESAEIAEKVGNIGIQVLALSSQGVLEGFVEGPNPETSNRLDTAIGLAKTDGDVWSIAYANLSKGTYLWHADALEDAEYSYRTALAGFQQAGDKLLSVFAFNSLGHLTRVAGRFREAARHYLDSMDLCQGMLFERGRCGCVLGTSGMALGLKEEDEAIVFYGAASRQYDRLSVKMIPPISRCYRAKFDTLYEKAEAAEPGKFDRLYRQGQRLTLPQAFDRARTFLHQVEKRVAPVGSARYGPSS